MTKNEELEPEVGRREEENWGVNMFEEELDDTGERFAFFWKLVLRTDFSKIPFIALEEADRVVEMKFEIEDGAFDAAGEEVFLN